MCRFVCAPELMACEGAEARCGESGVHFRLMSRANHSDDLFAASLDAEIQHEIRQQRLTRGDDDTLPFCANIKLTEQPDLAYGGVCVVQMQSRGSRTVGSDLGGADKYITRAALVQLLCEHPYSIASQKPQNKLWLLLKVF